MIFVLKHHTTFLSCNHSISVDRNGRLCKHWVGVIRRPLMTELLVPRSSCICGALHWACKNKHCRLVSAKLAILVLFTKIINLHEFFPQTVSYFEGLASLLIKKQYTDGLPGQEPFLQR